MCKTTYPVSQFDSDVESGQYNLPEEIIRTIPSRNYFNQEIQEFSSDSNSEVSTIITSANYVYNLFTKSSREELWIKYSDDYGVTFNQKQLNEREEGFKIIAIRGTANGDDLFYHLYIRDINRGTDFIASAYYNISTGHRECYRESLEGRILLDASLSYLKNNKNNKTRESAIAVSTIDPRTTVVYYHRW